MLNHQNITRALESLCPGAQWSLSGENYSDIVWLSSDINQPTEQQLLDEILAIGEKQEKIKYQRQREKEYPTIGDQLDMLWHAIDQNTLDKNSNFYLTLKTVKDKYPKG